MEFRVHVRGDRACFKRVEFAEDLVSYDVMTPLAARALLQGIHQAPDLCWRIDEIRVMRPIRSTWMSLADTGRRGEGAGLARIVAGRRDLRMANVLVDVGYVVTARLEVAGGGMQPHAAIFRRRLASERFTRPLYLGLPAFPAHVSELDASADLPHGGIAPGAVDLGWMLYDAPGDGLRGPQLFRPTMVDGVIDLRQRESLILAR